MSPQSYLTSTGKKIFKVIYQHCQEKGIADDIDTFELSMLANAFDVFATNAALGNKKGFFNEFKNGTVQVNAYHTICKDNYSVIMKHSPKFGLNPSDREKITKISKPEDDDNFDDL
mgnify:CR=1 FL=1